MELEVHLDRFKAKAGNLAEALNHMYEVDSRRLKFPNIFVGVFHPEVLGSGIGAAKNLGSLVVELARLTPHTPELIRLYQESKAESPEE